MRKATSRAVSVYLRGLPRFEQLVPVPRAVEPPATRTVKNTGEIAPFSLIFHGNAG